MMQQLMVITPNLLKLQYILLKTRGWKYINGIKYYKLYNYFNDASAYVPVKYFTKKYNDMSYLTIYRVKRHTKVLSDDMDHTDNGMWYGKGDIILVNNHTLNDKYVDTTTPMQDGVHNADGYYSYNGGNIGGLIKNADFKRNTIKVSGNTKFLMNRGKDYYTNNSLARGGVYIHKKFCKIYSAR